MTEKLPELKFYTENTNDANIKLCSKTEVVAD